MGDIVMEEGKLLSEALSTVKIQVQQMKRHLVRHPLHTLRSSATRPKDIQTDSCSLDI
jgi:vacuolar protein sorting-associated protein 35